MKPGFVSRITTGAPLPNGADAVVQVEDSELISASDDGEESVVSILVSVMSGHDVRPVGVDINKGDLVLNKGIVLKPPEIGLLACLGLQEVGVVNSPTVAVMSTGNEVTRHTHFVCYCNQILDINQELKSGCVYDSNRPALLSSVSQIGGVAVDLGIASDLYVY